MIEVKADNLGGESITGGTISIAPGVTVGSVVKIDQVLFSVDTDKVAMDIKSEVDGVVSEIFVTDGSEIELGQVLAKIDEKATAKTMLQPLSSSASQAPAPASPAGQRNSPAAVKMMNEQNISPKTVTGGGKGGRITKADVINSAKPEKDVGMPMPITPIVEKAQKSAALYSEKREERVKMTKIRQIIAARLKESQNTAAILTTFNEIDMTNVISMRFTHKEGFEKKHGVKLGFMSFFIKAVVLALKEVPAINAEISKDEIIYKYYYDIGVAVGTDKGLVVPVMRNCDAQSFADLENAIVGFGKKAREGTLQPSDMSGATFTISNGGVYGSLFSTPIISPPQSGILGMHSIQKRPVVRGDQIVIRPMMYVALSYDHRIVDGQGAVTFLTKVKEYIEDPGLLMINS